MRHLGLLVFFGLRILRPLDAQERSLAPPCGPSAPPPLAAQLGFDDNSSARLIRPGLASFAHIKAAKFFSAPSPAPDKFLVARHFRLTPALAALAITPALDRSKRSDRASTLS